MSGSPRSPTTGCKLLAAEPAEPVAWLQPAIVSDGCLVAEAHVELVDPAQIHLYDMYKPGNDGCCTNCLDIGKLATVVMAISETTYLGTPH